MRNTGANTISSSTDFNQRLDNLITRAQQRSGLSYETFVRSVTENAFRMITVWNESDLERLLVACEVLQLSPVSTEIFAIKAPDQGGSVKFAIGLDGWMRLMEQHPAYDGMRFTESEELMDGVPSWIECTIYRRDRRVAMSAKEYLFEARRAEGAWLTHPRRMLRHKALVQCARLTFALPSMATALYHGDLNLPPKSTNCGSASRMRESDVESSPKENSGQTQDTDKQSTADKCKQARARTAQGPSSTKQLLHALSITATEG